MAVQKPRIKSGDSLVWWKFKKKKKSEVVNFTKGADIAVTRAIDS